MRGDAAEGVGVRRGQGSGEEDAGGGLGVRAPELKARRADGWWENEFGLRGLNSRLGDRLGRHLPVLKKVSDVWS